jgi:hypothetical protein
MQAQPKQAPAGPGTRRGFWPPGLPVARAAQGWGDDPGQTARGGMAAFLSFRSPTPAPCTFQHAARAWAPCQAGPILLPAGSRRQVPQHSGRSCGHRPGPPASACARLWAGRAAIRPIAARRRTRFRSCDHRKRAHHTSLMPARPWAARIAEPCRMVQNLAKGTAARKAARDILRIGPALRQNSGQSLSGTGCDTVGPAFLWQVKSQGVS